MPTIAISDKAAERGAQMLAAQTAEMTAPGLRVRVAGGGCSGLVYKMEFGEREEGDEVFEHNGFTVYIDKKSLFFLNGSRLDYADALTGAGFRFENPNAKGSCGCGESFAV